MSDNRTSLIVAMSLKTIKKCSRIVFIEDGYVKEDGTFNQLLKVESGLFAKLASSMQRKEEKKRHFVFMPNEL